MGLEINREKTQVVNLKGKKASLDFFRVHVRYDRSQPGRGALSERSAVEEGGANGERDRFTGHDGLFPES